MKAVVAAFNQEKALVGAFSVIVQLHRLIVYSTILLLLCSAVHRLVIRQMALMWQMICNCRTSTPDKAAAAETIFNMQLPFISTFRYLN